MKFIKLTQGKRAIVDDKHFKRLNKFKWYAWKSRNTWYAIRNKDKQSDIRMHNEIIKIPKGMVTDHINHDGLDNREKNLRAVTRKQNAYNRIKRKGTSSQYKGVCLRKNYRDWIAQTDDFYIGQFKTAHQAALAYDLWANNLFGGFARTNFKKVSYG
jgi:hypothetical protein